MSRTSVTTWTLGADRFVGVVGTGGAVVAVDGDTVLAGADAEGNAGN